MERLESQLKEVCDLLNKVSTKTLKLSYLFRELDYQETSINFKMKHGFSWKKKLQQFKEDCAAGRDTKQPNAWQFGVEMCNRWSITQKIQSIMLENELRISSNVIRKGGQSIYKEVFEPQEQLNTEYIYEQKLLREKKFKLLQKNKFNDWKLMDKFRNNQKIIHWLKSGEIWTRALMCWEESSSMRHFKGIFEIKNSASFLQLENFQMFENSLFYKKFLNISQTLKKHFALITEF